ncbi:MAG: putative sulfate/molybdate transporter [Burkholderiaceae bacterium]
MSKFNSNIHWHREMLSGLGDLGTLIPYLLGYILVVGMPAQQVFGLMGLLLMGIGTLYRLPMPVQPMKAIGALAIVASAAGQPHVQTLLVMSSLLTAAVWLLLAYLPMVSVWVRRLPTWVGHGIALLLGLSMVYSGLRGIWLDQLPGQSLSSRVGLMNTSGTDWMPLADVSLWGVALIWVLVQLPLTVGNAYLATLTQVQEAFPQRNVSPSRLALTTGGMNLVSAAVGGFPVCHGVGGLAGYRMLGGKTGLPVVSIGLAFMALGLLVPVQLTDWLAMIPSWLVGLLLCWAGVYLARSAYRSMGLRWERVRR